MFLKRSIWILYFLVCLSINNDILRAQDYGTDKMISDSDKLLKSMQAGPQHALLEKFSGKWRQLITILQKGAEPIYGKGEADIKLIFGGRYAEIEGLLSYMDIQADTRIILGFDRRFDKYTLYAMDALTTYSRYAIGVFDNSDSTFKFSGKSYDIISGKEVPFRIEIKFEDDSDFAYTTWWGDSKEEVKQSQIKFIKIE
ncbi:MAG: hypothetical protein QG635_2105 [Bacteroidota bacterium]|nr:hypothetical protein [Bacteroidota bacterium]